MDLHTSLTFCLRYNTVELSLCAGLLLAKLMNEKWVQCIDENLNCHKQEQNVTCSLMLKVQVTEQRGFGRLCSLFNNMNLC